MENKKQITLIYGADESKFVGWVQTGQGGGWQVWRSLLGEWCLLRAGHGQPMVDLRTNIADPRCLENNKGSVMTSKLTVAGVLPGGSSGYRQAQWALSTGTCVRAVP